MTNPQAEARAILREVLAAHRKGNSASAPIATALSSLRQEIAAKDERIQALNDECQQSMLDIARERDRAERAEAQLAEITEGSRQEFAANMGPMRAYWLQTDHTRLMAENGNLRAQLAEARKALNAGEALSRQLHAVIDRLNGQAYSSTLSALNYFDAARRALEAQGGENG